MTSSIEFGPAAEVKQIVQCRHEYSGRYYVIFSGSPARGITPDYWSRMSGLGGSGRQHIYFHEDEWSRGMRDSHRGYYPSPLGEALDDYPDVDEAGSDHSRHLQPCSLGSAFRVNILVEPNWIEGGALFDDYFLHRMDKSKRMLENRRWYESRIQQLRLYAEPDGKTVSEESVRDFWAFVQSTRYLQRAGLALMNNGNIRAVWEGDDLTHLGLNFLGDQLVRFVIFKRRPSSRSVSRVVGVDNFDGIKKQLIAYDLTSLVNG